MHQDTEKKAINVPSTPNPLEKDEQDLLDAMNRREIETAEIDDEGNEKVSDDPFE